MIYTSPRFAKRTDGLEHDLFAPSMTTIEFDHCLIHVSNRERSNIFYQNALGAALVQNGAGWMYRFDDVQLNLHGPGLEPRPVAKNLVRPDNSDPCFEWSGSIERDPGGGLLGFIVYAG